MSKRMMVSRNGIDGLLLGIRPDKRDAATSIAIACGYNPARPHPFYQVDVAICLVKRLGELMYPTLSEADAQRQLGYDCSKGYAETISGLIALSKTRVLKVGEALRYALEIMHRESLFIEYQMTEAGNRHYHIEVTNWPYHPSFLCGALMYNLEVNGAERPVCESTLLNEMQYAYEISWS